MSGFPKKFTIGKDGTVLLDDYAIAGVTLAEIKNVNPGHSGLMEVVLHIRVREIDVQYRQPGVSWDELCEE